jgi:ribosomal protein L27
VANFIESHQEDGSESQHHAGEIVTSGNLLVDEQGKYDGHKGKQSVEHGNDDDRFAVAHGIDKEQASQGVQTLVVAVK